MGCHTWFYKRVSKYPSDKVARKACRSYLNSQIDFFTQTLKHGVREDEVWCCDPSITNDEINEQLRYLKRVLRNFDKFETKTLLVHYWDFGANLFVPRRYRNLGYIEGYWVVDVDDFYDVFRKYGYPKVVLTTFEEACEYYKDPRNECVAGAPEDCTWANGLNESGKNQAADEWVERNLRRFFDKYKNGLIAFG